jgi:hypothetical protein
VYKEYALLQLPLSPVAYMRLRVLLLLLSVRCALL